MGENSPVSSSPKFHAVRNLGEARRGQSTVNPIPTQNVRTRKFQVTGTQEFSELTLVAWKADNHHGEIRLYEGRVSGINIWLEKNRWTLGDIIEMIGEPEWVDVEIATFESDTCGLMLYFTSRGTMVPFSRPDGSGRIEASQYVRSLSRGQQDSEPGYDPTALRVKWQGFRKEYCE